MLRQKRDRWLNVRVSEDELAMLKRLAETSRISFSGYVRACLLDDPKARKRDEAIAASLEELRRIRTELLREGNNFNQIAYELNRRKGQMAPSEYAAIASRLEDVEARRKELLSSLGKLLAKVG